MALLQQITFISSYEQDAGVLIKEKNNLTSSTSEFQELYRRLQEFHLSEVEQSICKNQIHLSSLLQQMQISNFLSMQNTNSKSSNAY